MKPIEIEEALWLAADMEDFDLLTNDLLSQLSTKEQNDSNELDIVELQLIAAASAGYNSIKEKIIEKHKREYKEQ